MSEKQTSEKAPTPPDTLDPSSPAANPVGTVTQSDEGVGGKPRGTTATTVSGAGNLAQTREGDATGARTDLGEGRTGYGKDAASHHPIGRHLPPDTEEQEKEEEIVADPEGARRHGETPAA